jgi:hypothetical protein
MTYWKRSGDINVRGFPQNDKKQILASSCLCVSLPVRSPAPRMEKLSCLYQATLLLLITSDILLKINFLFLNEFSYNFLNENSENKDEDGWHSIASAKLTGI